MQTIKPSKNNLFCKPDQAEDVITESGFYIDKKHVDKPQTAQVINVGTEVKGFKSKDTIVYRPYATTEVKLDNETYFLIGEDDVLGTLI